MGEEGEKEVGGEEVGREEGGVKGPMEMNVRRVRAGCEGVRIVDNAVVYLQGQIQVGCGPPPPPPPPTF